MQKAQSYHFTHTHFPGPYRLSLAGHVCYTERAMTDTFLSTLLHVLISFVLPNVLFVIQNLI